ncbi:acetolactate synthase large subunit [Halobium salinum]|uniref:Acetolactate synthase large subunit n=1 Tax=Halobium salinum TaxID=1364940 RepID=A0ABD5PGP7_9EURY|nr:acetolactate synthase large subunit [Halobium salinum]
MTDNNAADLLVECLEAEGVERIYGLPGEELAHLMMAIKASSIEFVPVRHEQGAAFMADVHGRLTGDAGVCLSTLGPGATNLLTGVADAHLDKAPLVAITGQASREKAHKESHQMLDVVDIFESTVKWNTSVDDPAVVNETVRKAFKLAEYEKPGATHLELPEDVASEAVDDDPLPTRDPVRRPDPDTPSVERAAELIEAADHPIVLAGNGAVRTDAAENLRTFVEETHLPVVATYMGKGAISDRDPHSLMTMDSGPEDESTRAIERADLVLAVGYDIAEHDPESWNPDRETTVVHLDHEPAEVYAHYNPELEIVADLSMGLERLAEAVEPSEESSWCEDEHDAVLSDAMETPDDEGFTVEGTLPYLREAMADDDVLLSDVGSHKMAIAKRFPVYEPNTCIISNGLASMGIAVPGAVAADLAVDGNVVAATGDGGFLMNAAELNTADRLGCGFTVLLFNDDEYRLITEEFEHVVGDTFGTELTNPDYVDFAESFGMAAYRPESWADLEETLDSVVGDGELSLVEVRLA